MKTGPISQNQIDGNIVNSVTGLYIDSSDPQHIKIPEFVLKSLYDLELFNKANIDGSNTDGGFWYHDGVYSNSLIGNKQVYRVMPDSIVWGNHEITKHKFNANNSNAITIKVGANEGVIWNEFNFNPNNYALTDGSNAEGELATVIQDSHTHNNKALLDSYNQTNGDITDAVNKRHTHANKAILDAITAAFTTADDNLLNALGGLQFESDQTNAVLRIKDGNGNILTSISLAYLNNEGTKFQYNSTNNTLDLLNDAGQVLSSIPVSSFVTNLVKSANWNGSTPYRLDFKDNAGTILFSIDYTINNIQGLQAALDGKLNLRMNNLPLDLTQSEKEGIQSKIGVNNGQLSFSVFTDHFTNAGFTFSANQSTNTTATQLKLNQGIIDKVGQGATAYSWGNHANAGYLKIADLSGYALLSQVFRIAQYNGNVNTFTNVGGYVEGATNAVGNGTGSIITFGNTGYRTHIFSQANKNGATYIRVDGDGGIGDFRFLYHSGNFNPATKANALENATGIGFSNGNFNLAPYIYHSSGQLRFLATQEWVNSQGFVNAVYGSNPTATQYYSTDASTITNRTQFYRIQKNINDGALGINVVNPNNPGTYGFAIEQKTYNTSGLQYRFNNNGWSPLIDIWDSSNFNPNTKANIDGSNISPTTWSNLTSGNSLGWNGQSYSTTFNSNIGLFMTYDYSIGMWKPASIAETQSVLGITTPTLQTVTNNGNSTTLPLIVRSGDSVLPTNTGILGSNYKLYLGNGSPDYGMVFYVTGNGNGHIQQQRSDGTNTAYNLNLQPIGGNVGIGITNPQAKLHVNGNAIVGNVTAITGNQTLTFDNIVNYGQPLNINANASLGINLQANGNTKMSIANNSIESTVNHYVPQVITNLSLLTQGFVPTNAGIKLWGGSGNNQYGITANSASGGMDIMANQTVGAAIRLWGGTDNTAPSRLAQFGNEYIEFYRNLYISNQSMIYTSNHGTSADWNAKVSQSQLTTALGNYVPINGVTTINNTKTFTSSPVVPNGTLNGHTVNVGQLNSAIASITPQNFKLITDNPNDQLTTSSSTVALVSHVADGLPQADYGHPGNSSFEIQNNQTVKLYASYDQVYTQVESVSGFDFYPENIRAHIYNIVFIGVGNRSLTVADGVYAGDQLNITAHPGASIDVGYMNGNIISSVNAGVGNMIKVKSFANLIWDANQGTWVLTSYGNA